MRLFIAIDFEELSGCLKALQQQLPGAKATFPKQFHLTLKFLGEVSESDAEKVRQKLRKIHFRQFRVKLKSIGVFPSEKFIRVVWAGFEDGRGIEVLQKQIDSELADMFKKEKDFQPHITLARIKFIEEERKKEFAGALRRIDVEQREAAVTSFKLIKSTLLREGPVYEDIEVFKPQLL